MGPAAVHLHLTPAAWAADGLPAIFFVVGVQLKREFVAGDLRDLTRVVMPILPLAVATWALVHATVAGPGDALRHRVTLGVIAGLVLGKPLGIWGTTSVLARFTHASLDDDLAWRDVLGVSLLAGIGFTVLLLIGELAFGYGTPDGADVKIVVLTGSIVAGLPAAAVLRSRNAANRRIHLAETADTDHDGVPDVYGTRQD